MKAFLQVFVRLALCLCLAAGGLLAAWSMSDQLYTYRSPLAERPPEPADPPGPQVTRRMVIVLVDGLRYDTSLNETIMPTLTGLRRQGASARMLSRAPSYSQAGYTTLFTGAWPELNDSAAFNLPYGELHAWTQDNLFSAASRRGLWTAVAGYHWLERMIPSPALTVGEFVTTEDPEADRSSVDQALPWLEKPDLYPFILIHLMQVDYAGHHLGGPRSPGWNTAARQVDDLLSEIVPRLDLAQDTLLVVSDHGHVDRGGHGGQDAAAITEPFILAGRGVKPGQYRDVQMVDVTPTVAALMGLNLPASGQGRARTEMLDLPADALADLLLAEARQQEQLYYAYAAQVLPRINLFHLLRGQASSVKLARLTHPQWSRLFRPVVDEPNNPDAWRGEMAQVRSTRLSAERAARALLLLPLTAALGLALILRRAPGQGWRLLAAGVYLTLFHLRYALVDGRTYTFSSTSTLTDFVLYCLLVGGSAYLAAWGLWAWKVNLFHTASAAQAVRRTLNLTGVILFAAGLPALANWVINGLGVQWTLPDMRFLFWGWMGAVNIAVIAVMGLIFSGIAALVVWLRRSTPRLEWVRALVRAAVRVDH